MPCIFLSEKSVTDPFDAFACSQIDSHGKVQIMKSTFTLTLSLVLTVLMVSSLGFSVYAQSGASISSEGHNTQIFGCTIASPRSTLCDPMLNDIKVYREEADFSTVADLYQNNPQYEQLGNNPGLKLEGRSMQSLLIPNSPQINPPKFSVSFDLRNGDLDTAYSHIVSHVNRKYSAGWSFELSSSSDNNPLLRFRITSKDGNVTDAEANIPREMPVHIVGTFDGSKLSLYENNVLVAQANMNRTYVADPDRPLRVGSAAWSDSTLQWTGVIRDLMIFNGALSQGDVNIVSNPNFVGSSGQYRNPLSSGKLVGYWPLHGDLQDYSGNLNEARGLSTLISSMAFSPDGRLFLSEKDTGMIRILKDDKLLGRPFVTIPDFYVSWEQGLLGIAIDPKFGETHYIYLYYTAKDRISDNIYNRLVRFTENNNTAIDIKILLDKIPAVKGYHSGGALAFGPDEKLYVTVGDMTEHEFAQDPNILTGKILRLNRDGSIPSDNPFPGSPIFTLGHRNNFGIAFDPDGNGFATENGDGLYDSIKHLEKGGNYGFPDLQPANKPQELADSSHSILPIRSYRTIIAPTQMIYYNGDKFPELKGKFLFGTFTGNIYALTIDKDTHKVIKEDQLIISPAIYSSVIGIAQSPSGDIYFGAWHINKLRSITKEKSEILFPVSITTLDHNYRITQMNANPANGTLQLNIGYVNSTADDRFPLQSNSTKTVEFKMIISKKLMQGISSVTNVADKQLQFKVSQDDASNSVTLDVYGVLPEKDQVIRVHNAAAIPELPPAVLPVVIVAYIGTVIVASKYFLKY